MFLFKEGVWFEESLFFLELDSEVCFLFVVRFLYVFSPTFLVFVFIVFFIFLVFLFLLDRLSYTREKTEPN